MGTSGLGFGTLIGFIGFIGLIGLRVQGTSLNLNPKPQVPHVRTSRSLCVCVLPGKPGHEPTCRPRLGLGFRIQGFRVLGSLTTSGKEFPGGIGGCKVIYRVYGQAQLLALLGFLRPEF